MTQSNSSDFDMIPTLSRGLLVKASFHDCWQKVSLGMPIVQALADTVEVMRRALQTECVRIWHQRTAAKPLELLIEVAAEKSPVPPTNDAGETECDWDAVSGADSAKTNGPEPLVEEPAPEPREFFGVPLVIQERIAGSFSVCFDQPPDASTMLLLEECAVLTAQVLKFQSRLESMERERQLLRNVTRHAPVPIIGLDAEQRVTSWNAAATQLFGWKEHEVKGQFPPMVPPTVWPIFRQAAIQSLFVDSATTAELVCARRDSRPIPMTVSLSQKCAYDDRSAGTLSIWIDQSAVESARRNEDFNRDFRAILENFDSVETDGPQLIKMICSAVGARAGEIWQRAEPSWWRIANWCDARGALDALRQSAFTSTGWAADEPLAAELEQEEILFLRGLSLKRGQFLRRAADRALDQDFLAINISTDHIALVIILWGNGLTEPADGLRQALLQFHFELRHTLIVRSLATQIEFNERLRSHCDLFDPGQCDPQRLDDDPPLGSGEPAVAGTLDKDHQLRLLHDVFAQP